jgi:hypothetical protein
MWQEAQDATDPVHRPDCVTVLEDPYHHGPQHFFRQRRG